MGMPSSHWFNNILQDLSFYVVGNADASRLGNPFKAGGDIYTVPEDIVVVDDYVAEVNADAEFDPDILRHVGVLRGHATLDFNGTAHRIDGAGKLYQHAVASGLDDAASVGGYSGVYEGLSESL